MSAKPSLARKGAGNFKWEFVVPARNLRQLALAVNCLSKIGKELLIDATAAGETKCLNFRTLNDGKSAFCAFRFEENFFDSVRFENRDQEDPNDESLPQMAAALPLPALSKLLRGAVGNATAKTANGKGGAAAAAKKVLRLRIALEESDNSKGGARASHMVFQFEGALGERRRHRYLFHEQEVMAALFDTTSASSMVAQPLQLNALLDHLRTYDVSFLVSASLLKVRSYHNPIVGFNAQSSGNSSLTQGQGNGGGLTTEMSVSSNEFDRFTFVAPLDDPTDPSQDGQTPGAETASGLEVELVFGLREIKGLVAFCLAAEADGLTVHFIDNGLPLQVTVAPSGSNYSAELFLSTMQTDDEAPARIAEREERAEEARQRDEAIAAAAAAATAEEEGYGDDEETALSHSQRLGSQRGSAQATSFPDGYSRPETFGASSGTAPHAEYENYEDDEDQGGDYLGAGEYREQAGEDERARYSAPDLHAETYDQSRQQDNAEPQPMVGHERQVLDPTDTTQDYDPALSFRSSLSGGSNNGHKGEVLAGEYPSSSGARRSAVDQEAEESSVGQEEDSIAHGISGGRRRRRPAGAPLLQEDTEEEDGSAAAAADSLRGDLAHDGYTSNAPLSAMSASSHPRMSAGSSAVDETPQKPWHPEAETPEQLGYGIGHSATTPASASMGAVAATGEGTACVAGARHQRKRTLSRDVLGNGEEEQGEQLAEPPRNNVTTKRRGRK